MVRDARPECAHLHGGSLKCPAREQKSQNQKERAAQVEQAVQVHEAVAVQLRNAVVQVQGQHSAKQVGRGSAHGQGAQNKF